MSTPDTSTLLAQLRAVLTLTNTEIQVAETRIAQARTEAVRRELSENADKGRARAEAIEAAIRDLGSVPEVVGPFLGRAVAAIKAMAEQAQPFDEALLGDLALEHQLLDRARYIKALATAASQREVVTLADRLITAHSATVEWLTTVLAEDALGGPAALRRTVLQAAAGTAVNCSTCPSRGRLAAWTARWTPSAPPRPRSANCSPGEPTRVMSPSRPCRPPGTPRWRPPSRSRVTKAPARPPMPCTRSVPPRGSSNPMSCRSATTTS